jgi:hypothetical protein
MYTPDTTITKAESTAAARGKTPYSSGVSAIQAAAAEADHALINVGGRSFSSADHR